MFTRYMNFNKINTDFFTQNKTIVDEILRLTEANELVFESPQPDFYLIVRGKGRNQRICLDISIFGYRKLARKQDIVTDTTLVTRKMVESGYFKYYDANGKKAIFDMEKNKLEFSKQPALLSDIAYIIVNINMLKFGVKMDYIFDIEWIYTNYAKFSRGHESSLWKDKGFNGIAMHKKSVIRHVLKEKSELVPPELSKYEENYNEYWDDDDTSFNDLEEEINKVQSIEVLRALFTSPRFKKSPEQEKLKAIFMARSEVLKRKEA